MYGMNCLLLLKYILIVFYYKFYLYIIIDTVFVTDFLNSSIKINQQGKTITHTYDDFGRYHCYINCKLTNGIHHFVFVVTSKNNRNGNNCDFGCFFGGTTDNSYKGNDLCSEKSTCCCYLGSKGSSLNGGNGYKYEKPNLNLKLNEEIELIFDMKEKRLILNYQSVERIMFRNFKDPLYPFVIDCYNGISVTLSSYWSE